MSEEIVNVIVADDHELILDGIQSLLQNEANIKVIGTANSGEDALNLLDEIDNVQVVILDISMPGNGIETTRKIKNRFPSVQVMILTMHREIRYIIEAIQAGASGYILKNRAKQELVLAIDALASRHEYFDSNVLSLIISYIRKDKIQIASKPMTKQRPKFYGGGNAVPIQSEFGHLTTREQEILRLVAKGHTAPDISQKLSISRSTVETHRRNIIDKLGLNGSKELLMYAIDMVNKLI